MEALKEKEIKEYDEIISKEELEEYDEFLKNHQRCHYAQSKAWAKIKGDWENNSCKR